MSLLFDTQIRQLLSKPQKDLAACFLTSFFNKGVTLLVKGGVYDFYLDRQRSQINFKIKDGPLKTKVTFSTKRTEGLLPVAAHCNCPDFRGESYYCRHIASSCCFLWLSQQPDFAHPTLKIPNNLVIAALKTQLKNFLQISNQPYRNQGPTPYTPNTPMGLRNGLNEGPEQTLQYVIYRLDGAAPHFTHEYSEARLPISLAEGQTLNKRESDFPPQLSAHLEFIFTDGLCVGSNNLKQLSSRYVVPSWVADCLRFDHLIQEHLNDYVPHIPSSDKEAEKKHWLKLLSFLFLWAQKQTPDSLVQPSVCPIGIGFLNEPNYFWPLKHLQFLDDSQIAQFVSENKRGMQMSLSDFWRDDQGSSYAFLQVPFAQKIKNHQTCHHFFWDVSQGQISFHNLTRLFLFLEAQGKGPLPLSKQEDNSPKTIKQYQQESLSTQYLQKITIKLAELMPKLTQLGHFLKENKYQLSLPEISVGGSFKAKQAFLALENSFEAGQTKYHYWLSLESETSSPADFLLTGFSPWFKQALLLLKTGFRLWQPTALQGRGMRQQDLSIFLRHCGLAHFAFFKALQIVKDFKAQNPTAEFSENLLHSWAVRIGKAVCAHYFEKTPDQSIPIDQICGPIAQALLIQLLQFVVHAYDDAQSCPLVSPWGKVNVRGVYILEVNLLEALMRNVQAQSQSKCLKNQSANYQPVIWDEEYKDFELFEVARDWPAQAQPPYWLLRTELKMQIPELTQSLVFNSDSLSQLQNENFYITYNGSLIIELDAQSLEINLQVEESRQPSPQQLAATHHTVENQDLPSDSQDVLELGTGLDWFELNPRFFLGGKELKENEVLQILSKRLLEYQGKMYLLNPKKIPNLQHLEAFWKELGLSDDPKNKKPGALPARLIYPLAKNNTLTLLALRARGQTVTGGPNWQKICDFYDSLDKPRKDTFVSALEGELKPYQSRGVRWLMDLFELRLGGILADDMGLGKTVQALSFLETLSNRQQIKNFLIVVPASLTYNWLNEAHKFTPQLKLDSFQPSLAQNKTSVPNKDPIHWVISYGLFLEHEEFLRKIRWDVLIYDEAQNLKNIRSKRTTTARSMPARFKLCLTGTPMENHLGEFFSLLDTVVPGSLGSFQQYQKKYVTPKEVTQFEIQQIKHKIRPLLLRRTKKEIEDQLPAKTESLIKIPFEEKQRKVYRDIALAYNEQVKQSVNFMGETKSQLLMLTALLRLRQVCSHPGGIPSVKYNMRPPKLDLLTDSLKEIIDSGESALVFTQFVYSLQMLEIELKALGITVLVLHGAITIKQREQILKRFNEENTPMVLAMTLKTGGVGLNLTKASYVFHLDPWWNPAVENQATDRVYRLGQTKHVQVYRYIMEDSVEEKIEILKERKSKIFNSLLSLYDAETNQDEPGVLESALKESDPARPMITQADFNYLIALEPSLEQ